jgi:dipeptidyl aminopeptidase/acylaminoacyl peptidase
MKIARFVAALAALCAATWAGAQDKPSIESFFKLPESAAMYLSPDGRSIAALSPVNGHQNLVIIDLRTKKAKPVTGLEDRDVVEAEWINSKRLIYYTGRLGERDVEQRGGGLFAVNADGTVPRLISEGRGEKTASGAGLTFRRLSLERTLPDDSDDIIVHETVYAPGEQPQSGGLYRLNTSTGRKVDISLGKPESGDSEGWVVDSKGVARAFVVTNTDLKTRIFYRAAADAPWKKHDEFDSDSQVTWYPQEITEDDKGLYVTSRQKGDRYAIYRYDPETKQLSDAVAAHPRVDLTTFERDHEAVRGVRYNGDYPGNAWFYEGLAKIQAVADKQFPDNTNRLQWTRDRSLVLITTFSDVMPSSFYLYETKSGKMEWLADSRPWIDPKKQSAMKPFRYKARDGIEIPAYLTIPKASSGKNLPLVMVIHGGPNVPGDSWRWNPEVQFLASRGYAVIQPNYRGTTRYGYKFQQLGWKNWGLSMQDDITDGVRWAVAEGIADPNRVCIYGGSYGGYAAMMGAAKDPDLYKCAINYVGVTDLKLLLTARWSDTNQSDFGISSMKRRVGEVGKDDKRLHDTSPVNLASRIKIPVLMAYGGADVRVIPEHGTSMRAALERAGNTPQWIIVNDEGHGYRKLENQVMFYGAMEKFLDKNIGSGAK